MRTALLLSSLLGFTGLVWFAGRKSTSTKKFTFKDSVPDVSKTFEIVETSITSILDPINIYTGASLTKVNSNTYQNAIDHIKLREGFRLDVYNDSLGKPTVGYGHLVTIFDNLKVGDTITENQADSFLQKDAKKAFNAANSQAKTLGLGDDSNFIVALTGVNFQLGTGWNNIHKKTWAALRNDNPQEAIRQIKSSLWHRQTPTRTNDFIRAITSAYINKGVNV